ncbi:phosphatase domain-containing protein [Sphaerisporangium aureirubrum]|uniref:AAA family ATPase n=1 Tax=Sphaerisporangium aureirubrum TaxID=1544736 RepID=A0ABW1NG43_9ACTN
MSTFIICRGLPASGKTTWARAWVADAPGARARVNRDDIRAAIHNGAHIDGVTEPRVRAVRDAQILALLTAGSDVVLDDTNLSDDTVRHLADLARSAGAGVHLQDFTNVPLQVCIDRDAARDPRVGEDVIRGMHTRYLHGRDLPLPMPEGLVATALRPYEPEPDAPRAVLVDIDGTLALRDDRGPYDWDRVGEDLPNRAVIAVVCALAAAGHRILFVSSRPEGCRDATLRWLHQHVAVRISGLHLRRPGDQRPDYQVKADLFDAHVRDHYDIVCALEDRRRVVAMWRALGLTVLQVADGDF